MGLIDVDGIRLDITVTGTGAPPVVFLSCSGGSHDEWADLVPLLSGRATCLTYCRPGIGDSDPLPPGEVGELRTASWAARQLRSLLVAVDLAPPYVLVSSSLGGFIADQYAVAWPEDVAGLVLTDPTNRTPWPEGAFQRTSFVDGNNGFLFDPAACYTELARSVPSPDVRAVVVSSSVGRWQRDPPLSRVYEPLTLDEVDDLWQGYQRDWAAQFVAVHIVADTAGHFVARDAPDLVAVAVHAVLDAQRTGGDLHVDPRVVAAAGGYLVSGGSAG